MSCRRDGASYLASTIADVDESARSAQRVVVSDDLSHRPEVPSAWSVVVFEKPTARARANCFALWKCFELAADAGENLIVFEDDVQLCKNGARYMEGFRVPGDCAFVSFFAPWGALSQPIGVWRARMHVYMFCQAMKFPLRTVRELQSRYPEMRDNQMRGGADDHLQILGEKLGWTYGVHYPNLVQHVGAVSAVGNGPLDWRTSPSFRGAEWDALNLYPPHFD